MSGKHVRDLASAAEDLLNGFYLWVPKDRLDALLCVGDEAVRITRQKDPISDGDEEIYEALLDDLQAHLYSALDSWVKEKTPNEGAKS